MSSQILSELLTAKQAQAVLPFSLAWYNKNRWLKTGLPYVKIGGRVFYRRSDLIAFTENHVQRPASDAAPATASEAA